MPYRFLRPLFIVASALTLLSASDAAASWPMARGDASRAGACGGKSDLAKPVPYWRTYLGGSIGPAQLATADVDGDGKPELLFSTSGRIVAKRDNDAIVWQSVPLGLRDIYAIVDVDGDGAADIVSSNPTSGVVVLSAKTGAVEWREPAGEMGTVGGVRIGDLDGDGKPELLIQECGCCGLNSGKTGFVYSFASGFAAPKLLWTTPFVRCGGGQSLTLVDVDGDKKLEVLLADSDHFELFNGANGTRIGFSETTTSVWNQAHACRPFDIDGEKGEELVCVLNSSDQPADKQRRVTVLKYFTGVQMFHVLWSNVIAPDAGGDVRFVDPVVDLDGDGKAEVIVSGYTPGTGWSTHVMDAMTGADLVTPLVGHTVSGTAEMTTKGRRVLLTNTGGTSTVAHGFTRTPTPTLTQLWVIPDHVTVTRAVRDRFATQTTLGDVVAPDLDHDGLADLITVDGQGAPIMTAYSAAAGAPKVLTTRTLPPGVNVQRFFDLPAETGSPVALARTDGYLELLDTSLGTATCCGEFPKPLVIRVGGFYASGGFRELTTTARTFPLGQDATDSIVVPDSRGTLLRLDPKEASLAVPPSPTWEKPFTTAPTLVAGLDGTKPGLVAYQSSGSGVATSYQAVALRADASTIWSASLPVRPLNDLTPANLDGDAIPDFVSEWGSLSDVVLNVRALSGKNGSTLWNAAPVTPGAGRQPAGISVAKWNADGIDDLLLQGPTTYVLDGTNGASMMNGGSGQSYFLPVPIDIDGDGTSEVVVQGGYAPVAAYSHDLATTLYASTDDDRPYPYGAIVRCSGEPVLVEGSLLHPARLKLTALKAGVVSTVVLAGGKLFTDETAAGTEFLGQLTSTTAHTNLLGGNRPTALVGSTDGHLYGVNPCAATLDFSVELGVAVGEAVFGDTDGDGRDEIIVGAADGFLYGLKNEAVPSPAPVLDVDLAKDGAKDISEWSSTSELSAAWSASPGATGYEVAVVDEASKLVAPWRNVGADTHTTIKDLKLSLGARYAVAVRALSPKGPSPDALSDGVLIVRPVSVPDAPPGATGTTPPADAPPAGADAGGEGGGCGCVAAGAARTPGAVTGLAFSLGLFALARRRRRPVA